MSHNIYGVGGDGAFLFDVIGHAVDPAPWCTADIVGRQIALVLITEGVAFHAKDMSLH